MSTYWYFECLDHTPPLRSDGEFTQHTDDDLFWEAVALAGKRPLPEYRGPWDGWQFNRNAHLFLYEHPKCRLALVNEYGEHRALDTTELELKQRQIESLERQAENLRAEADELRAQVEQTKG